VGREKIRSRGCGVRLETSRRIDAKDACGQLVNTAWFEYNNTATNFANTFLVTALKAHQTEQHHITIHRITSYRVASHCISSQYIRSHCITSMLIATLYIDTRANHVLALTETLTTRTPVPIHLLVHCQSETQGLDTYSRPSCSDTSCAESGAAHEPSHTN
jgi:hypothetical protein